MVFMSAAAPDVGTGEDVAHLYFKQLVDGMARPLFLAYDRATHGMSHSNSFTHKACATETSNQKTYFSTPPVRSRYRTLAFPLSLNKRRPERRVL